MTAPRPGARRCARIRCRAIDGNAPGDVGLPYHAYSASGEVTRPSSTPEAATRRDYDWLAAQGIDIKGKIALVRYSVPYSYRGFKALTAEQRGAAGILIYSDPADDGFKKGRCIRRARGGRRATSSAAASSTTSWCPAIR